MLYRAVCTEERGLRTGGRRCSTKFCRSLCTSTGAGTWKIHVCSWLVLLSRSRTYGSARAPFPIPTPAERGMHSRGLQFLLRSRGHDQCELHAGSLALHYWGPAATYRQGKTIRVPRLSYRAYRRPENRLLHAFSPRIQTHRARLQEKYPSHTKALMFDRKKINLEKTSLIFEARYYFSNIFHWGIKIVKREFFENYVFQRLNVKGWDL